MATHALSSDTVPTFGLTAVTNINPVSGFDRRYTNVIQIGRGGSAEIYRCFDQERGHDVALKRIRSDRLKRKDDCQQFLSEPDLIEQIHHHTLPSIFDVFPKQTCSPYFSLELLNGINLCKVLQGLRAKAAEFEDAFPLDCLMSVLVEICEGLSMAHSQDIVHRDIKPENIMLTRNVESKLIDWGSAMQVSHMASGNRGRYATKQRQMPRHCVGSPLYMSPEQVNESADLDERADIYSLGVVMYDCLALTTMISARSVPDALNKVVRGVRFPPSQRTLRESVPKCLEDICMKATNTNPKHRYSSIDEFAEQLQQFTS